MLKDEIYFPLAMIERGNLLQFNQVRKFYFYTVWLWASVLVLFQGYIESCELFVWEGEKQESETAKKLSTKFTSQ